MAAGIASFRMYNASPAVAGAWKTLFEQVFADLDWPVQIVPHAWPASLTGLWQRRDLVCGFMCGLPFARHAAPVVPLAVPVPSPARYAGEPRYLSEFLVRRECGWSSLEHTFGHRIGWMVPHSQSGYQAARTALARFAAPGQALYSASVGPLDTPARVLTALQERQIDVTVVDGYFLDLLRHHEPTLLAGLVTIAVTPWTPNPLLVAADCLPPEDRTRLADKLTGLHDEPRYTLLLRAVLVSRFVAPDAQAYAALPAAAEANRHYPEIR